MDDVEHAGSIGRLRRPVTDDDFDASGGSQAGFGGGNGFAAAAPAADHDWSTAGDAPARPVRIGRRAPDARPTGRERHDEKITVYCSPEELLQIEQARLTLRGSNGLAVDRGRIVREAIAIVLADFEAKGDSSILVRRLRGR